jgi:hypothetical protein
MTLLTENCPWQALMDVAYDRWQTNPHIKSFKDMLNTCTPKERAACILGKLNQQVENGGFLQWVDNGYAMGSHDWLESLLESMGPVSKKVLVLCQEMLSYCNDEGELQDEDGDGDHDPRPWEASNALSTDFYNLEEEWHPEIYAYLASIDANGCPVKKGNLITDVEVEAAAVRADQDLERKD